MVWEDCVWVCAVGYRGGRGLEGVWGLRGVGLGECEEDILEVEFRGLGLCFYSCDSPFDRRGNPSSYYVIASIIPSS